MANGSYFQFHDDDDRMISLQSSHEKVVSWTRTAQYIALKIIERIDLILDTH